MKKLLLAAVAVLALTGSASAVTNLSLSGPADGNILGPQSTSSPCVIAGTQCQNPATFGFNNFVQGNTTDINAFSSNLFESLADNVEGQAYTVGQIINALGGQTAFNIILDVNRAGPSATDTLNLFRVRIDGALQYEFDPGAPGLLGGVNVAAGISNNGNGFGDWSLGTVNLAGYDLNAPVIFFAAMSGLTDGAESFWIQSTNVSEVPLPGALVMFASALGIGGGGAWWRKRRRKPEMNSHPLAA